MKDRIEKFLKIENITPAKFAEEIGVQRSSISHILSGRNNPSLELIQKILQRFNYINAEWLILGKGEMFKPERQPTIFDELIAEKSTKKNEPEAKPTQNKTENNQNLNKSEQMISLPAINENLKTESTHKKPEKIIILYDDGTASVFEVK